MTDVLPLAVALTGAYGVYLLYTAVAFGWRGVGVGSGASPSDGRPAPRARAEQWLAQAGLEGVSLNEFVTVMAVLFVVGTGLTFAVLGGMLPAVAVGAFAATYPAASYRARRQQRRARAAESWPRMIEEAVAAEAMALTVVAGIWSPSRSIGQKVAACLLFACAFLLSAEGESFATTHMAATCKMPSYYEAAGCAILLLFILPGLVLFVWSFF